MTTYPLYVETDWNEVLKLKKQEIDQAMHSRFTTLFVFNQTQLIAFGGVISDGVVYACIYDVIVMPKFQQQGIGSAIVRKLLVKCRSANVRSIYLFAAKGAEPFYQKLGFARPSDAPEMKYEFIDPIVK